NNNWLRPVYFASTVSRQSQLGLQHYFRFEGKAFRVVPQYHEDISYFGWVDPEIHADAYRKFRFRQWNEPDTYLNTHIRRMISNYRYGISALVDSYMQNNKPDSAAQWLAWGQKHIPFTPFKNDKTAMVRYAYSYMEVQDSTHALQLADRSKEAVLQNLQYH